MEQIIEQLKKEMIEKIIAGESIKSIFDKTESSDSRALIRLILVDIALDRGMKEQAIKYLNSL